MVRSIHKKRAFTIVEILVTISIIGLLVGLLLPALAAVKRQSRKKTESNYLKQLHYAWMLYGNQSNEAALPGYLDTAVQAPRVQSVSRGWGVRYEFPDQSLIPPAPNYLPTDLNAAGPWTWRLMKYLDHTPGYVEHYEDSAAAAGLPPIDQESVIVHLNSGAEPDAVRFQRALAMAESPIFGYNGFYIGGVWKMRPVDGIPTPYFEFYDHCEVGNPSDPALRRRVSIPLTISQVRRSTEVITFCGATRIDSPGMYGKFGEERPGTYLVTPRYLATNSQWQLPPPGAGGVAAPGEVEVFNLGVNGDQGIGGTHAGIPYPRFGSGAAVLYVDGHIDQQQYNALADMRMWIDNATHRDYQHDVCPPAP